MLPAKKLPPPYNDYEVDALGRLYSLKYMNTGCRQQMKHWTDKKTGYVRVRVCVGGRGSTLQLSRVVAAAFIPNTKGLLQVNHIDGDKQNNHASNLEWVSPKENIAHALSLGLKAVGERCNSSNLTEANVREIKFGEDKRLTLKQAAEKYGVSFSTIGHIRQERTWTSVKGC